MTNTQRMNSDIATIDRREAADNVVRDSRIRNDELTMERRDKADNIQEDKRIKNDEKTANRREMKDGSVNPSLAVFLLTLIVLTAAAFLIFG